MYNSKTNKTTPFEGFSEVLVYLINLNKYNDIESADSSHFK